MKIKNVDIKYIIYKNETVKTQIKFNNILYHNNGIFFEEGINYSIFGKKKERKSAYVLKENII